MYGIGITTKDRPELLKALVDSIHKHTDMSNVLLHIEDDSTERLGVAKRKNNCLRALKDCSHVFLLDDDVEIIKDGWIEFFIADGLEHVMYLDRRFHRYIKDNVYADCGGVLLFLTKKAIEKVGAFDEKFGIYGFEHADYSARIYGHKDGYISLVGTDQYIYSHDYSTPNHKSSITDEEKKVYIRNNWDKFFKEPIKDIYIPL